LKYLIVLAILFSLGCATNHQKIGKPPTDDALQNDGTPQARDNLRKKHQRVFEDGSFWRQGKSAEAHTDEAYNYLSTSDEAKELLDGPIPKVDALLSRNDSVAVAIGALFGVVLGTSGAIVLSTAQFASNPTVGNADFVTSGLMSGVLGSLFSGAVFALVSLSVSYFVVVPVMGTMAADDYREAAQAFNADLDARIMAAGPHENTVAPTGEETPSTGAVPVATDPAQEEAQESEAPEGAQPPAPNAEEPAPASDPAQEDADNDSAVEPAEGPDETPVGPAEAAPQGANGDAPAQDPAAIAPEQ
jgi:hypothetical protein